MNGVAQHVAILNEKMFLISLSTVLFINGKVQDSFVFVWQKIHVLYDVQYVS